MGVTKVLDVENVLENVSLCNPFYVKLLSLLLFAGALSAMHSVQYVFVTTDTQYRCNYPNCGNIEIQEILNITLDDKCYRSSVYDEQASCVATNIDVNKVVDCTEWVYEDTKTFFGEFNLGCQDWKRPFVATVHCFGYMIGLLIMGPLADKIGRKKLIIITGLTAAIMGLGRSIVHSYWLYISLELIEAMFGDTYSSTFMLGIEMVSKNNRVTFIALMTATTSLAGILMAFIAWAVPYWRHFLRVIYAPALLFVLYTFLLDESLRWLFITGRNDKAKRIIERAARKHNVNDNESDTDIICIKETEEVIGTRKILNVTFSSRKLVLRFLACVCMWTTGLFNKYTMLINSVELEGNKYLNFGLTKFAELPASIALGFILKKYKRKIPLTSSFILTGAFCIAQSFVPKGHIFLSTSLFLVGKFMATISYEIVYLYTSELFPTYIRNTMHSLCSSLGRTTTMLAPHTPLLMQYWYGMPSLLIGVLSLVTGLIVLVMPDTSEDVLPDTVVEAENIGSKKDKHNEVTKF